MTMRPTNDYSSYWQSIPDPSAASPLDENDYSDPIVSRISKDEDDDNNDVVIRKVNSSENPNDVSTEMPMMKKKKRQRSVPPLPCYNKSDDYDEKDDREAIVELVRRYHHLPTTTAVAGETTKNNENVTHSTNKVAARDIELLTGYPMPGARILPDLTNAVNRSAFLCRIQPLVQAMEERKKSDIEEALCATRCEVRKEEDGIVSVSKKKGSRYCYFDLDRKDKVPTEEYQRRYTAMIIESRRRRCMRVAQQHHYDNDRGECRYDDDDDDDGSNMDMDKSTNMDDSSTMMLIPVVADNKAVDYADNLKEEDISPRFIKNNMASSMKKLDTPASSSLINNATSTSLSNAGIVPLSLSTLNTNNETSLSLLHHHNNLLLSSNVAETTAFESNIDPRILVAARQRLWHTIDVALTNYSREILATQDDT